MTVYIFTGPTLGAAEAREVLDAVYLPPAAQGDVYRVAQRKPQAIGIVDGYFERLPSIWHKEILWAMREGIHVFGSSSMGALRAAELAAFGMEGVGKIFEAYQSGELEDDDEVAVAHAPAESGYQSLSVAMVNIRATLAAAEAQGVIRPETHASLIRIGKELFYPDRTYTLLLARAGAQGLDGDELAALEAWLPEGQINQKREDALALLRTIRERRAAGLEPKRVRYHFEHTVFWEYVVQTAGDTVGNTDALQDQVPVQGLLDEALLDAMAYSLARRGAINAVLAQALADQQGQHIPADKVAEAITTFRQARSLLQPEAMQAWLEANDLEPERFYQLIAEEATMRSMRGWAAPSITSRIVDQLRLDGRYAELWQRAQHKERCLEDAGLANPSLDDTGLTRPELLQWYFARREEAAPLDLFQYLREAGFRDEYFFFRALLREFCYVRLTKETSELVHPQYAS